MPAQDGPILVNGVPHTVPFARHFRPLTPDEWVGLCASIGTFGMQCPVVVTEKLELLDGLYRVLAAQRLGVREIPVKVVRRLSRDGKWRLARSLNADRRHLSPEDLGELLERLLADHPTDSNGSLAARAGVDESTVRRHRNRLEAQGRLRPPERTVGLDGRLRAARRDAAGTTPGRADSVARVPAPQPGSPAGVARPVFPLPATAPARVGFAPARSGATTAGSGRGGEADRTPPCRAESPSPTESRAPVEDGVPEAVWRDATELANRVTAAAAAFSRLVAGGRATARGCDLVGVCNDFAAIGEGMKWLLRDLEFEV